MTAVPLGDARDHLSEYVTSVQTTHERVAITRHGHRAAVLISADELDSMEETLDLLSTPGAVEDIRCAEADIAAGRAISADETTRILADRLRADGRDDLADRLTR